MSKSKNVGRGTRTLQTLVRKPFRTLEEISNDAEYRIYGGELCWKEISFNDFLAWCVDRAKTDPSLFDCDVESIQDAFEDWVSPSANDLNQRERNNRGLYDGQ